MDDYRNGYIAQKRIHNSFNKPIRIKSGEVEDLNNRVIHPGHGIVFAMHIPQGYREYTTEYWGLNGEPTIYVGYVLEDAGDNIYTY